jgi:hypothetical protein
MRFPSTLIGYAHWLAAAAYHLGDNLAQAHPNQLPGRKHSDARERKDHRKECMAVVITIIGTTSHSDIASRAIRGRLPWLKEALAIEIAARNGSDSTDVAVTRGVVP